MSGDYRGPSDPCLSAQEEGERSQTKSETEKWAEEVAAAGFQQTKPLRLQTLQLGTPIKGVGGREQGRVCGAGVHHYTTPEAFSETCRQKAPANPRPSSSYLHAGRFLFFISTETEKCRLHRQPVILDFPGTGTKGPAGCAHAQRKHTTQTHTRARRNTTLNTHSREMKTLLFWASGIWRPENHPG